MKNLLNISILMVGVSAFAACGGQTSNTVMDADSLLADSISQDTEVVTPQKETKYIHAESGDTWEFLDAFNEADEPVMLVARFAEGQGSRVTEMYEMRRETNYIFRLWKDNGEGGSEETDIIVYVYPPRADSVAVKRGIGSEQRDFLTAEAIQHAIDGYDPSYTPAEFAIEYGANGGKWETLQSGETVYVFPSGVYATAVWVKDGGKLYYVDISGCKMLNNYAHDGFYTGSDGSWDKSVKCLSKNILPKNGQVYTDDSDTQFVFNLHTETDGTITGTARRTYSFGSVENYNVTSFGSSTYALYLDKDDHITWHVAVLDGGNTIRVSASGVTEEYRLR